MEKKTYSTLNALYFALIISVVIFMTFVVYYMIINKEAFFQNPFIYGASKLEGDVHCSCIQIDGEKRYQFIFNKTHWWSVPTQQFIIP